MTSIFDKENDREILKAGELGNHLVVYEDRPMKYDAWDIDIYYQEKGYEVEDLKTVSVEKSSLMTKVKMDWNYQDSTISQEIRFYNDNRRIDFVTHADWHEHQQLLRVLFPLDIRTSEATFDIQYGNVKRPTYENTSWDIAKFETVAHQWADYSETGYGVSLMNDCKYGYSARCAERSLETEQSALDCGRCSGCRGTSCFLQGRYRPCSHRLYKEGRRF